MSYPLSPAALANDNTWDASLYKEAFDIRWERDFTSQLAISMITEYIPGNYSTRIEIPTILLDGPAIKDTISCTRGTITPVDTGIEGFDREDRYYKSYEYCPDNIMRTKVSIESWVTEADRLLKLDVMYRMDKDAVDIAIASAGVTLPAVTDAATAQDALDAVTAQYAAFSDQLDVVAIIPSTMVPFFRELGAVRETVYGDQFFKSGTLYDIFGVKLRVVDAARLTDPDKVLFTVGKPVKFYYEKMGLGVTEFAKTPDASIGEYVNTNRVREVLVEGDFHVWSQDEKRITVAG
jgi:hypothetical protein